MSVDRPSDIDARPPTVYVNYEGPTRSKASFEQGLHATGAFGALVATKEAADVVLTVRESFATEASAGVLLNAVLLFTLPLPAIYEDLSLDASWQVGEFQPFGMRGANRTIHYWGGIPLLLFSLFVSADQAQEFDEMGRELALRAHASYAALFEKARKDALTGETQKLAMFVDAFPGTSDEAQLQEQLEGQLWQAIAQGGSADAFFAYIFRYPQGVRTDQARELGREAVWEELRGSTDLEQFAQYARAFPKGDVDGRWTRRVDEVAWSQAVASRWVGDYRAYLSLLPTGPHANKAKDVLAWAEAEKQGSIKAFQDYLERWPSGEFQGDARSSLALYDDPTLPSSRAELARWVNSLRFKKGTVLSANRASQAIRFTNDDQTSAIAQIDDKYFVLRKGTWYPVLPSRFLQTKPDAPIEQ